jgi:hypothetical protein
MRYLSDFIGSRNSQTITYWNKEKSVVVCGCFKGTLPEFENRVKKVYQEDNIYYKQYMKYIAQVKMLME